MFSLQPHKKGPACKEETEGEAVEVSHTAGVKIVDTSAVQFVEV
jgi:hypothetical protein